MLSRRPFLYLRNLLISLLLAALFLIDIFPFSIRPAYAATITVTGAADTQANDGVCTLREAIINAQADNQSGSTDCVAGAGADTINVGAFVINLTSNLPTVTTAITINGAGAGSTVINGGTNIRGFTVNGGTLAVNDLTIQNGDCVFGGCPVVGSEGAGIVVNVGNLTVTNSTFTNNRGGAAGAGGAISMRAGGTLTVTNSTFSGSFAGDGGAIACGIGTLIVMGSTFSGNAASILGGAITLYNNACPATITNSTFSNNSTATGNGGAIYSTAPTLNITNSTFTSNTAGNAGGGGVFNNGGITMISNSNFSGNRADITGGGAINFGGTLTVTNSTFSGNSTGNEGGGVSNVFAGTLNITNSTFSGNSTSNDGGGVLNVAGTVNISNSTFSGNTAVNGGGVNSGVGTVNISNSTFSGNTAVNGGGVFNPGSATVTNSIFTGSGAGGDCTGTWMGTSSNNLTTDACPGTLGAVTGLGTLGNNGGPTQTIPLLAGSNAIDRVACAVATDQRGVARPIGALCDIGAFEGGVAAPTGTITGHVFTDTNGNGTQEAGEPNLTTTPVVITTSTGGTVNINTDGNGNYTSIVPAGSTVADVTDPAGNTLTTANDPQTVNVPAGGTVATAAVGFQPRGTITGHVFSDTNGNGTQEAGEPNLTTTPVVITTSTGGTVNVNTDGNGNYSATVPAGNTIANVTGPAGSTLTTANDPQTVNVPAGGTVATTAVGFQPPATTGTITGHVFSDTNGNGTQEAGEPNLTTTPVVITTSAAGTVNVNTDAGGNYSATVPAGSTIANVTDPAGYTLTTANDPQTANVPAGGTVATTAVGFQPPATNGTITGHVFSDTNGNGTQEAGEPNLTAVPVVITTSAAGTVNINTDAGGNYTATVPAGSTIANVTDPAGATLTTGNDPQTANVPAGGTVATTAVGFQPPATTGTITGHVFSDTNGNGTQEAGEPNLTTTPVVITTSAAGTVNINTDAGGNYTATVPAGSTIANVTDPAGYTLTTANDPQTANVPAGGTVATTTVGFQPPATNGTITGHVFSDTNGNGTQEAGEPNLTAVPVVITTSAAGTVNINTDAGGNYTATVPAGSTIANVTDPAGSTLTTANDPQTVNVPAGGTVAATAVGFRLPVVSGGGASATNGSSPTATPIPPARPCVTAEYDAAVGIRADIPPTITSVDGVPVNICYAPLTDPVQYGVFNRQVLLAAEIIAFTKTEPPQSITRLNQPIMVCLRGSGELLYRDATGTPRVVTAAPGVSSSGGYTCAAISNVGTLILVTGTAAPAVNPLPATRPLALCSVTTKAIVNLRAAPDSNAAVLDNVPFNITLPAKARAGEWLQVVFGNNQGWLNVRYLTLDGTCE